MIPLFRHIHFHGAVKGILNFYISLASMIPDPELRINRWRRNAALG